VARVALAAAGAGTLRAGSASLEYRDEVVALAKRFFPGRVGVGPDGFAGRYL